MTNINPYVTGLRKEIPKPFLIDATNYSDLFPSILEEFRMSPICGFDIETEDSNRHEGLNRVMKIADPEEDSGNNKLVFDYRRTNICGFSVYGINSDKAYYFNLYHSDSHNRLTLKQVQPLLDIISDNSKILLAHNSPFELSHCRNCWGFEPKNLLCTMQLAVTCFGPDEYNLNSLSALDIRPNLIALQSEIVRKFSNVDSSREFTTEQSDLINKFCGKQSKAAHSYNGIIASIAYSYGLKQLVLRLFGHEMSSFKETLGSSVHMGQLTGEQVTDYGCEDAYWVMPLFLTLKTYLDHTNPALWETFLVQENPMTYVYSDTTVQGIKIDLEQVENYKNLERKNYAQALRKYKAILRPLITKEWLDSDLREDYLKLEKAWYEKSGLKTRHAIYTWVHSKDCEDDYTQCRQVNGSVSDSWVAERNDIKIKRLSITYYYTIRILLYDLFPKLKPIVGRARTVESDAEARGNLIERNPENKALASIINMMHELGSIEQRMKLYINPYVNLADPDTSKVYPVLSSRLASRRMAGSNPNFMQLDKISYVRGFFVPDDENSMIVSLDWSQVELVLIAELSQDPEFVRCYSQLPYEDLHKVAMSTCYFSTPEVFDVIKHLPEDLTEYENVKFVDNKGNQLTGPKFYKWARKEIGKVSNFNYWYSGALASVGERLNWSTDKMWEVTDAYRTKFHVAEAWREGVRNMVANQGYVTLIDNHRRVRLEATSNWYQVMLDKFGGNAGDPLNTFGNECLKRISRRSLNQAVNSVIQGGCAAITKRSILSMEQHLKTSKLRARFMQPIHDELLYNVHRDDVVEFIAEAKKIMLNHPDLVKNVLLDCTASIGLNFRAFNTKDNLIGQFELDEAPEAPWIPKELVDSKLTPEMIQVTIDNIFKSRGLDV